MAVFIYKRGAEHVKKLLETMEKQLDETADITEKDCDGIEGPVASGFRYDRWANGAWGKT